MRRLNWPFLAVLAAIVAFWAVVLHRVVWG